MLQNWNVSVNYAAAVMDTDALVLNCKMLGTFVTKLQRQLGVQETRTKNCIMSVQDLSFAIPGIYCKLHRMKMYTRMKYKSVIIKYPFMYNYITYNLSCLISYIGNIAS